MRKSLIVAAFLVPLSLSGCVISVDGDGDHGRHSGWEKREKENRQHVANLVANSDISAIKRKMGVPDFSELHQSGTDNIQVLFYRTQRKDGDGITTKDECTPLVFKNDVLIGWGDTAYNNI